jgi:molybdopterin synthase catalytic subunit
MQLRVRFFARLREIVGQSEQTITLDDESATADDVFTEITRTYPQLADLRGHLRVAVDRDFVPWDHHVSDGAEVAFIPPVSGGTDSMGDPTGRIHVTKRPIDVEAVVRTVRRPSAGALVTFEGVVRDHTGDRDVEHLEYDCYVEMAFEQLEKTAVEATEKWPDVEVAVHHRWGRLEIGEVAVAIAVSSPHRADAFDSCRWMIDRLKEVVPIWKKEVSPDGSEWVGMGP